MSTPAIGLHERLVAVYSKLRKSTLLTQNRYTRDALNEFSNILAQADFSSPDDTKQYWCMRRALDVSDDKFKAVIDFIVATKQWHLCLFASGNVASEILHLNRSKARLHFDEVTMCYRLNVLEGKFTPDSDGFTRVVNRPETARLVVYRPPKGVSYAETVKKVTPTHANDDWVNDENAAANNASTLAQTQTTTTAQSTTNSDLDKLTDVNVEKCDEWLRKNYKILSRLTKECRNKWKLNEVEEVTPEITVEVTAN